MPPPAPKPGFLVIGAQKCGTSWLHRHLSAHPGLWMPPGKDSEFFSYRRHLREPGIAAYLDGFSAAGERLAGEATASYFWTRGESPWCRMPAGFEGDIPGVVRDTLGPDLRIVVSLRDPVERALSAWAHYLAHGELDPALPFREAARYGGIADMGFYARHLERWAARFSRENFHVVVLERDIIANPARTLDRLFRFLGKEPVSFQDEEIGAPVFPGLHRGADEAGGRTIELSGAQVRVSPGDLVWLRGLYRDQAARLAPWLGPEQDYPWPVSD